MKGDAEIAALAAALDADDRLEMEIGEAVGRFRLRQDRAIRDMEAARLLPLGRDVVCERMNVKPSTVYKMVNRDRKRYSTVTRQA